MSKYYKHCQEIIMNPLEFFKDRDVFDKNTSVRFAYAIFPIGIILSFIMNMIVPLSGVIKFSVNGVQVDEVKLFAIHFIAYLAWPCLNHINSAIVFMALLIPAMILGIKINYTTLYQLIIYSLVPVIFLGSFPYINFVANIWSYLLFIIGLKHLFKTSYIKAILAVVFSIILLIILFLLIGFLFLIIFG